jgi:hypothetical protein
MEVSIKDLAEFARLGLRFHILTPSAVVEWADRLIAESDVPAPWVIDLSLSRPNDVEDRLRRVPGEPQLDMATRLFLGLVRRRWREGRLTIGEVRGIGWSLHCDLALPAPGGRADWGVCLEAEGEEFDQGWRTEADLRESIEEKLAQYADIESWLPNWVEKRGQGREGM